MRCLLGETKLINIIYVAKEYVISKYYIIEVSQASHKGYNLLSSS